MSRRATIASTSPLCSFDEVSGEWQRDGRGILVDSDDQPIAEDRLAAIKDGSYRGVIFASGEVDHFSYWNVDWPIDTHGSLSGTITVGPGIEGPADEPAEGAQLTASGITYTGLSSPKTIGADGRSG